MKKYLINIREKGGFSFSDVAFEYLINFKGWSVTTFDQETGKILDKSAMIVAQPHEKPKFDGYFFRVGNIKLEEFRSHPDLIDTVETLGLVNCNGIRTLLVMVHKNGPVKITNDKDRQGVENII